MAQTGTWNHIDLAARLEKVVVHAAARPIHDVLEDEQVGKDAACAIRDLGDRLDRMNSLYADLFDQFASLRAVLLYFFGTTEPELLRQEIHKLQLSHCMRTGDMMEAKSLAEIRAVVGVSNGRS